MRSPPRRARARAGSRRAPSTRDRARAQGAPARAADGPASSTARGIRSRRPLIVGRGVCEIRAYFSASAIRPCVAVRDQRGGAIEEGCGRGAHRASQMLPVVLSMRRPRVTGRASLVRVAHPRVRSQLHVMKRAAPPEVEENRDDVGEDRSSRRRPGEHHRVALTESRGDAGPRPPVPDDHVR